MASDAYRDAGVDIEAGYAVVKGIKQHVARTQRPEVLGGLGFVFLAVIALLLGSLCLLVI